MGLAMLIVEGNGIDAKVLERTLNPLPDMRWLAVYHFDAEFGGDDRRSGKNIDKAIS